LGYQAKRYKESEFIYDEYSQQRRRNRRDEQQSEDGSEELSEGKKD